MVAAHIQLGQRGEDLAAAWYAARRYRVLDRNWRCPLGEIDLVVARRRTVVICEVKTRTSAAFGVPALAVTPAKQRRLRRLAAAWLRTHRIRRGDLRFDVVAITGTDVEVYENAF
jgi:putative endonuclease